MGAPDPPMLYAFLAALFELYIGQTNKEDLRSMANDMSTSHGSTFSPGMRSSRGMPSSHDKPSSHYIPTSHDMSLSLGISIGHDLPPVV